MKKFKAILGAVAVLAAGIVNSQSQPYYVAGADLTPPWNTTDPATQMSGGPSAYNVALPSAANTIYEFKIAAANWAASWPSGGNAKIKGDPNGTNTFYFYPGTIVDGWQPLANRVGYADPGNMTWGVAGDFNNWDGTQLLLNSIGNGVFSNSVMIASAGSHSFKFQSPPGSWSDVYFGADFQNGGSDGGFTTTNASQTVPVVLDLPHGRWLIGSLVLPPVTNNVVFAVDMTYQTQLGYFHPGSSVSVSGGFNGWPVPGSTNTLALTNYPTYKRGSNTNIYYGTNVFIGAAGASPTTFKYQQTDASALNSGWESSGDRTLALLNTNGTLLLPVSVFSDLYSSDVLSVDTTVTFTVNMTNAVGTDAHAFDPNNDYVFINGDFLSSWADWNPISLAGAGLTCTETPVGSLHYVYQRTFPAGSLRLVNYKYSINGVDDEAGYAQNHTRYIRGTNSTYALPMDTFGNQYVEPKYGIAISRPTGGTLPLAWLGYPNTVLQTSTNVAGPWSTVVNTDTIGSTNYTIGGGNQFFRLIQSN